MGDVAMYTGFATGAMMFASPVLFSRWGWRRVAGLTPSFMLLAGLPFFAGCMAFSLVPTGRASRLLLLKGLVLAGALLQVGPACSAAIAAEVSEAPCMALPCNNGQQMADLLYWHE